MLRLCITALAASPYCAMYDGYLKSGTLEKREGCLRDVPKSEHIIFLRPETTDYKEDALEDEEDMY